jgi:tryptophan synthase alpha chain
MQSYWPNRPAPGKNPARAFTFAPNYSVMQTSVAPNRLAALLAQKANLLNIYFTAGFPQLADTVTILESLAQAGADVIEIGMPYSDPLADGPTIQQSSQRAIDNGMTLRLLFEQLRGIRARVQTPLILMGYLNPVLQFGIEAFCQAAAEVGVDGLILPDLPLAEYEAEYRPVFKRYGLSNIFLVTPQTSEARIRRIDALSDSFIYLVSSASTTGAKAGLSDDQLAYFERIRAMQLRTPQLIGFGIADRASFERACAHARGAIIGSAFIKLLAASQNLPADIGRFVREVKGE